MSSRVVDPRSEVRPVEFDLLDEDRVPSDTSALSRLSLGSSPGSPEVSWLEDPVAERPRVLRGASAAATAGVDVYELPPLDTPYVPVESPTDESARGGAHRGAAAVAWAVGYRDGLEQGRSEGLALGHAEGLAAGTTIGHDRALLDGRNAADAAVRALDAESRRTLDRLLATTDEIASSAAELAFQIAELVLERELQLAGDPAADAVRRAARLLPDTGAAELDALTARLHPDDIERMTATPEELVSGRTLQVVADRSVSHGSCVLESGATRVDATVPAALGRLREALGLAPTVPQPTVPEERS